MFELNYFIIGIIALVAIIIIMLLVGYTKARPDIAAVIFVQQIRVSSLIDTL